MIAPSSIFQQRRRAKTRTAICSAVGNKREPPEARRRSRRPTRPREAARSVLDGGRSEGDKRTAERPQAPSRAEGRVTTATRASADLRFLGRFRSVMTRRGASVNWLEALSDRRGQATTTWCSRTSLAHRCASHDCWSVCCSRRQSGRSWTRDVASVPPYSFVAAQRSARAGEDRARATRTREHSDDAEHLHARRRCVAPRGDRAAGKTVVPNCSQVSESGQWDGISKCYETG